jgi:4-amino-4-deoxy-L-arabinose transferase
MIFYERETLIGLIITSIPAILSVYFYFIAEKKNVALALLLLSAFLLRILMISLDPFVREWDERFHALVAKNMIEFPFKPMLFMNPIMAYNYHDWGSTHIWVHKQPLFLWQMALSMKLFGVNTFALRLPSAIMGSIMVWLTYDCSRKWILNDRVAFIAAFLSAFAYYALELISGWMSLEHNDLSFVFYTTCCFWAFTNYIHSDYKMKWAVLIGLFAGMAILNKWLVGLLIFGGWGLYLLLSEYRLDVRKYMHLGVALIITCVVFVPWQLYILHAFPVESAISFEYNRIHMNDDLGHPGNMFYHIKFMATAYHYVLLGFLAIGIVAILSTKHQHKNLTVSFLAMIVVLFSFFSILVATKMPAFVYPVSALILIFMAYGIYFTSSYVFKYLQLIPKHQNQLLCLITLVVGFWSIKPALIMQERSDQNPFRNNKIHNSSVYQNLDDSVIKDRVIINCRPYENIELMFYKNVTAYHWYPGERVLDSLQLLGYQFAAFEYENDQQKLPDYIVNDKNILILDEVLK